MKLKLFILSITISNIAYSQITKGEISFEIRDSFSYEYQWEKAKRLGINIDENADTVTVIDKDFIEKTWVVNKKTYKQPILTRYGIFSNIFNQQYVLDVNKYFINISDFSNRLYSSYRKNNDSTNEKITSNKLFSNVRIQGKISDLEIDKQDTIVYRGFKGYKIKFIETFEKGEGNIIKMYVTEAIEYPVQMLVNYPTDLRHCPLLIEIYKKSQPKNKTIYNLLSIKEVNKETDIQQLIKLANHR